MKTEIKETGCCPIFDPAPWDDKMITWDNKLFIKSKVCTLLYVPLNFGGVMKRLNAKVELSNAQVPDWLCLSDHTSPWKMDLYLAVDKEIRDAENVKMNGTYYSRVYEGNFKDTDEWRKDFEIKVKEKGIDTEKIFMWYTTCPKCAKVYGKNYVVILAKTKTI